MKARYISQLHNYNLQETATLGNTRSFYKRRNFFNSATALLNTAQKIKFSIKDFFSKCDQIRRELQIWSHLRRNP